MLGRSGSAPTATAPPPARAALPAAGDTSLETLNAVALAGRRGHRSRSSCPRRSPARPPTRRSPRTRPTASSSPPATRRRSTTGLSMKGRSNLRTKVNAASKLIKIEETSASLPEALRAPKPGKYMLAAAGARARRDLSSDDFEGDAARRQGMGGLVAIDEVSIVCMPDAVNLLNGDDVMFRDAQGKLISPLRVARRPHVHPRHAAGPHPAGDPRVAQGHGRLRLEDGDAVLAVDRGHRPAVQAADHGPAVRPRRRPVGAHRRHSAACTRRPPTRSSWARRRWASS